MIVASDLATWAGVVVAALGGAAIGVERQRSGHATGAYARFGGVRTFTLLGGLAGMAGWMVTAGLVGTAIVVSAGAVALIVAAYVAASRRDVDATTETAALVVIAAGILAGTGRLALASGAIAVTALVLVEKSRLHALVARLDDAELRAAVRFGVMAVVILPLLPEGPVPWLGGAKPRELWLLVLFFNGLSFLGYFARRAFGPRHGYPLAGALAGLISSTSVTYTFARLSRDERPLSRPLAIGTIAACTMLFPRVLVATSVLHATVAWKLLPYAAAPLAVGVVTLLLLLRSSPDTAHSSGMPSNPLQVGPALQMAATFQLVLFAVNWVRSVYGDLGLLVSGAVLGVSDVDAMTISMAKSASGGVAPAVAARAIAIGMLANSILKLSLAVALGTSQFRRTSVAALAAMVLAIAASLVAFR